MLTRLRRALRRHGFVKSCYLLAYNGLYYLRRLGRAAEIDTSGRALDDSLGVETTQIVELGALDVQSTNVAHGVRYQPSDVALIRRSIRECEIDYSEFVFVDYGCGKGRVMLVAAEFPFRKIVGVEFSHELQEIAKRNIEASLPKLPGCRDLQVVLGDAVNFSTPAGPLVCYFYNPFAEPVMRKVITNIEQSLQQVWRRVLVIYVDPMHSRLIDSRPSWKMLKREHQHVIYQNLRVPASAR